jgi:hypothetical protein
MVYKENNKPIPGSCKSHGCLIILTKTVEERLLKEENFD